MSSLFDRLKQSRGQQVVAMEQRLEQQGQKTFKKDPRIWKYTWNKEGVSENRIRMLSVPMVDMKKQEAGEIPEDQVLTPVAMLMKHQFQGPGGWYVANSPQTFGEEDPVRIHDGPLWRQQKATNDEALKKVLKERLPDTKYYANILVINDVNVPENNGKVMLFEFGPAFKKFLDTAQNPRFATDRKFDPYDFWEGADIILNLVGEKRAFGNWEGLVPKWENVKWDAPQPMGDDKFIQEIWEKEHSLFEFFDRKNFSTFQELEGMLRKVLQIPNDQPLVEQGAATMATSPNAEKPKTEPEKPKSEEVKQEPAKTETAKTETAKTETPPGAVDSIEDFAAFLQQD